jgi:hypothetical protein
MKERSLGVVPTGARWSSLRSVQLASALLCLQCTNGTTMGTADAGTDTRIVDGGSSSNTMTGTTIGTAESCTVNCTIAVSCFGAGTSTYTSQCAPILICPSNGTGTGTATANSATATCAISFGGCKKDGGTSSDTSTSTGTNSATDRNTTTQTGVDTCTYTNSY